MDISCFLCSGIQWILNKCPFHSPFLRYSCQNRMDAKPRVWARPSEHGKLLKLFHGGVLASPEEKGIRARRGLGALSGAPRPHVKFH